MGKTEGVVYVIVACPTNLEDEVDVEIPIESVLEVQERYSDTLYGYFLGKRVAYPVVKNYATNVWRKFGLQKVMMNSKGFFFFKFETEDGMNGALEGGPWIIRNIPIILNKWSPEIALTKEELSSIPVWVKFHDIPLAGFTEDGLSILAYIMLDSYTSTMCKESWSRPNFARALIEISAECSVCAIFGHKDAQCPKHVAVATVVENKQVDEDGFEIVGTKSKIKKDNRRTVSFAIGKPKTKLVYHPVNKQQPPVTTQSSNKDKDKVETSNSFGALNDGDDGNSFLNPTLQVYPDKALIDEESDIEGNDNYTGIVGDNDMKGASTPIEKFSHEYFCNMEYSGVESHPETERDS
ncbi:uncharacterized protein [Rutidosis leptorrhynchoides]|uniref:uncharacterized protein n=1 Tax=Rutidosis leptorrhynchoides TaxID=125765 RepID=UPI003A99ADDA